ncbi:MAG: type II toxin-antitoxin system PemK/MazF family toxin [Gammaproteobacteria bacterium]
MKRGELYRVRHPSSRDPKRARVFVVVSRQALTESRFSTVICAPVYSRYDGLATQVPIGPEEGMKRESSVHCDELMSLLKTSLTYFVGTFGPDKCQALDTALRVALGLD